MATFEAVATFKECFLVALARRGTGFLGDHETSSIIVRLWHTVLFKLGNASVPMATCGASDSSSNRSVAFRELFLQGCIFFWIPLDSLKGRFPCS